MAYIVPESRTRNMSAVIEMLEIDPTPPGQEARTPMFRDWRQGECGGMISYHTLRRELAADLAAVLDVHVHRALCRPPRSDWAPDCGVRAGAPRCSLRGVHVHPAE